MNILITGVSSGIGLAAAKLLTAQGHHVIGTTTDLSRITPATRIEDIDYIELNLRNSDSVEQLCLQCSNIDVLINNAGQSHLGAVEELSLEKLNELQQMFIYGPLRLIQACLPGMRQRNCGYIINISSYVTQVCVPFQSAYASCKLALEAITRCLRLELHKTNINACIIRPYYIHTAIQQIVECAQDSYYRTEIEAFMAFRTQQLQNAIAPEAVAQKISAILQSKKIKPVYFVGDLPWWKKFIFESLPITRQEMLIKQVIFNKFCR
ncbi:MAG: SDR family oxidoreductase [Gammaproteobacteria bacterium]